MLHGGCSLPVRCLPAACTAPARSVNGASRCLPAACSNAHVQTHWNGWVYCFAWLHWRSNWVILGLLFCYFCFVLFVKSNICLFFNQYIFSCKLKIWNQFLAVCIEKSFYPKVFFFFCRFPIENDNGVRVANRGF